MGDSCTSCALKYTETCVRKCAEGSHYKPIPQTNYDRIISKTPEELAKFLYIKTCEDGYPQFDNIPGWLDWLKQEATDES